MDDEPLYMLTAILNGGPTPYVIGPLSDLQEQYDAWCEPSYDGAKFELRGVHDDAIRSPKRVSLVAERVMGLQLDRL